MESSFEHSSCVKMQVRSEWESVKIDVMYRALKCKFSMYPHLNSMLISTAGLFLLRPHPMISFGAEVGREKA